MCMCGQEAVLALRVQWSWPFMISTGTVVLRQALYTEPVARFLELLLYSEWHVWIEDLIGTKSEV